jgi:N-acetylglutamate synthase-like GNAT family acetyltransferase
MTTPSPSGPLLLHAEPVLAVTDVLKTVNYYHEVLGFPDKWTWGEPPNHGGASWNGAAFLQFSLDPEKAAKAHGESIWIRAKQLTSLYEIHSKNGVEIVFPITKRPWGFSEYCIRDMNGYYITFAEVISERKSEQTFPTTVSIVAATPGPDDLINLCRAVGWAPSGNSAIAQQIESALYCVIAENLETNEIIGCAFLLGDHKTTYYVKDVIVHPAWQHKGVGTAMMKNLMHWLEANGAENATVGLFTGDHLAAFYRQFGFTQACGMYMPVQRKSDR